MKIQKRNVEGEGSVRLECWSVCINQIYYNSRKFAVSFYCMRVQPNLDLVSIIGLLSIYEPKSRFCLYAHTANKYEQFFS